MAAVDKLSYSSLQVVVADEVSSTRGRTALYVCCVLWTRLNAMSVLGRLDWFTAKGVLFVFVYAACPCIVFVLCVFNPARVVFR